MKKMEIKYILCFVEFSLNGVVEFFMKVEGY